MGLNLGYNKSYEELIPEYKAIRERMLKEVLPFFSWQLFTYGVPGLVLLVWVALMLFTIYSLVLWYIALFRQSRTDRPYEMRTKKHH